MKAGYPANMISGPSLIPIIVFGVVRAEMLVADLSGERFRLETENTKSPAVDRGCLIPK